MTKSMHKKSKQTSFGWTFENWATYQLSNSTKWKVHLHIKITKKNKNFTFRKCSFMILQKIFSLKGYHTSCDGMQDCTCASPSWYYEYFTKYACDFRLIILKLGVSVPILILHRGNFFFFLYQFLKIIFLNVLTWYIGEFKGIKKLNIFLPKNIFDRCCSFFY